MWNVGEVRLDQVLLGAKFAGTHCITHGGRIKSAEAYTVFREEDIQSVKERKMKNQKDLLKW